MSENQAPLSFEHGDVWLGGTLVPGILKRCTVLGQVKFDEANGDQLSGKVKHPMGWDDAVITLVVELVSENPLANDDTNCYEKLKDLNSIFKGEDETVDPMVYDIDNSHALARGIYQVVFSGLESQGTDKDDVLLCTLRFTEYKPIVTDNEENQVASTGDKSESRRDNKREPKRDERLTIDLGKPGDK